MAKKKPTKDLGIKDKIGRPSEYSDELAKEFCSRIATGKSMRTVCLDKKMPVPSTIFDWLRKYESFSNQYARACEERAQAHSENLLDMGDEAIALAQSVDPKQSNAVVSAVKLKADNLKWSMSKMQPKKFGDKLDLTSGGKEIKGNTIVFKNFKKDDGSSTGS